MKNESVKNFMSDRLGKIPTAPTVEGMTKIREAQVAKHKGGKTYLAMVKRVNNYLGMLEKQVKKGTVTMENMTATRKLIHSEIVGGFLEIM